MWCRIYVAKVSREGKNQKELSVKAGDIVEVYIVFSSNNNLNFINVIIPV